MSVVPEEPFDPGLQAERTLLAWRRTCLALGAATTAAVRFAAEVLGPAAVAVLGAAGVGAALASYLAAVRRYRAAHAELNASGRLPVDGAALGLTTVALALIGVAAGAFVIGASGR